MTEPEVVATDDVETVDGPVEAVETEPKDMETTIRETYRKLTADQPEATDEPTGKPRGKDGKFAKVETTEAPESVEIPTEPVAAEPADPTSAYPGTWKKEIADKWATLPPEIRAEVHRREQDFHKGIGEYREAAAFGKSIGAEMLPYVNDFRQAGTTPSNVVKDLMGYWKGIAFGTPEQKSQTILRIAQEAGIDIASLATVRPPDQSASTASPDVSVALQRIARLEGALQQQTSEQQRLAREAADAEIGRFRADPANEHFPVLESQMAALITSGQADSLKDAYDKALWLNPETRAKAIAKQDDVRRQREAAEAAAARKAASVNVVKRGTPPAPAKPKSMEDTIRETYRRLNS